MDHKTILLACSILLFLGCLTQSPQPTAGPSPTPATIEIGNVTYVTDGDTIKVNVSGIIQTVRYIGIDTPETKYPGRPVECFGPEADAYNRQLVLGKTVRLEKDQSNTDRYNRLLRYVYVGTDMVNEALVREGYATAVSYPPDTRYQDRFQQAETLAKAEDKGLWKACVN